MKFKGLCFSVPLPCAEENLELDFHWKRREAFVAGDNFPHMANRIKVISSASKLKHNYSFPWLYIARIPGCQGFLERHHQRFCRHCNTAVLVYVLTVPGWLLKPEPGSKPCKSLLSCLPKCHLPFL